VRLLGILLALGIALGLTVYVVDRVSDQEQTATKEAGLPALPGGFTTEPAGGAQPAAPGAIDTAARAACTANRATLDQAEETFRAVNGRYTDGPGLVAGGLLREAPKDLRVDVTPDGSRYSIVASGNCA
jgi:hypothetical protein